MSVSRLVKALGLPAAARVDRRIPKSVFVEQGAPTAADKRHIRDGIEQLTWVAALKPTTIGVAPFSDEAREYLEIAVLAVVLRPGAKSPRIVELIHRAIPYPVLLVVDQDELASLALAHKRRSQGEIGAVVLEETCCTKGFDAGTRNPEDEAFLESLSLAQLPRANMYTLYQGWLERVVALQAAAITGRFNVPADTDRAVAQHAALVNYARLEGDLARLRAAAKRERQLNRRVQLNLAMKRIESELAETSSAL